MRRWRIRLAFFGLFSTTGKGACLLASHRKYALLRAAIASDTPRGAVAQLDAPQHLPASRQTVSCVRQLASARRQTVDNLQQLASARRQTVDNLQQFASARRQTVDNLQQLASARRQTDAIIYHLNICLKRLILSHLVFKYAKIPKETQSL